MSNDFWSNPTVILWILILILLLDNFWSIYLGFREIKVYNDTKVVPTELAPFMAPTLFERMRQYKRKKAWLSIWNALIFAVFCGFLELFFGFYPFVWNLAENLCFASWMQNEILVSYLFMLLLAAYFALKATPAAIYESFCIEKPQKIAYRKPAIWWRILGQLIDLLVALSALLLITLFLVLTVRFLDVYFWIALYIVLVCVSLATVIVLPLLLQCCLGKHYELEEGPLRNDVKKLTDRIGFPISKVRIMYTNDPNMGSNAFFFGCGCMRRIVISDTLVFNRGVKDLSELAPEEIGKGLTNQMIVAVIAHELGHWKHGHFYKGLLLLLFNLLIIMALFGLCMFYAPFYQAVGFEPGIQPVMAGFLIIFGFVLTPYLTLSNFFMLFWTRHFEFQADFFAYKLGYGKDLCAALLKLYADNLSFPLSDGCYSAWNHTHPTLLQRLKRLKSYETGVTSQRRCPLCS